MIAICQFQVGPHRFSATLQDDGVWQCSEEAIQDILRSSFDPNQHEQGSELGSFGYRQVLDAGEMMNGRIVWEPHHVQHPGRVY